MLAVERWLRGIIYNILGYSSVHGWFVGGYFGGSSPFFSGSGLACLLNLCFMSSFHLLCTLPLLGGCEGVMALIELLGLGC